MGALAVDFFGRCPFGRFAGRTLRKRWGLDIFDISPVRKWGHASHTLSNLTKSAGGKSSTRLVLGRPLHVIDDKNVHWFFSRDEFQSPYAFELIHSIGDVFG
jgi:hypothetical protein